ncbi:protein kinase [Kitasatospora gansuensis]
MSRPAARLRHPGIVEVHEVGEHDGTPFLVMEFLDGYTLGDHLLDGWYPAATVADFGAQLAEALAFAHRAGTAHGGIEPDRLLLTGDGTVKILGFGTVHPAPVSDLRALGSTLHELLGSPPLPGSLGELGELVLELLDEPPGLSVERTEAVAARLRRLAGAPVAEEEPAAPPQRTVAERQFWIYGQPGRRPLGWVLCAVICAGLVAVVGYAVGVTV